MPRIRKENEMDLMNILTTLAVLAVLAGVVLLQVFLSGRENRYPGLILPALAFVCSFLLPLNLAAPAEGITAAFLGKVLIVFLLANILTFILGAIYFICRERLRRRNEWERISLTDKE